MKYNQIHSNASIVFTVGGNGGGGGLGVGDGKFLLG